MQQRNSVELCCTLNQSLNTHTHTHSHTSCENLLVYLVIIKTNPRLQIANHIYTYIHTTHAQMSTVILFVVTYDWCFGSIKTRA